MDVLSCPNCGESKKAQLSQIERGKYFCKTCGAMFCFERPLSEEEMRLNALIAEGNLSFENADLKKAQTAFASALSLVANMPRDLILYLKWNLFLIKYRIFPITAGGKTYYTSVSAGVRRQDMLGDKDFCELVQTKEYCDAASEVLDCADQKSGYYAKEGGSGCDIFICFKWKDSLAGETPDARYALTLYRFFTQRGYRVFFAPESLKNCPANNYDDVIKAALISAKVLFLPASKAEYVRAQFVRNEWIRFLALKNLYEDRVFVPIALNGMNPADFPFCTQGFLPQVLRAESLDLEQVCSALSHSGYLKGAKEEAKQSRDQTREAPAADLAASAKRFADDLACTVKTYAAKAMGEVKKAFDAGAPAHAEKPQKKEAYRREKSYGAPAKKDGEIFPETKPQKGAKELSFRAKILGALAALVVVATLIGLCFLDLPKSSAASQNVNAQSVKLCRAIDCAGNPVYDKIN